MKILHVINNLSTGGAERLLTDMVPIFEKKGVEVDTLLIKKESTFFSQQLSEQSRGKITFLTRKSIYNPFLIFKIIPLLRRYDIVHAHLFPASYWIAFASKFIGSGKKPFLFITEHSTFNKRRNKWYFFLAERFIYSSYNKIISISSETQENLMNWLRLSEDSHSKFVVINNGIVVERYFNAIPYKKSYFSTDIQNDNILLCMVGNFSKQKDQITVIKALSLLPQLIKLLLVGEGLYKNECVNLAIQLGIEERVYFLGNRNDVERIIKTCDIFILSSKWEGFGLAAVEGMAARKPVIASKVQGLSEIVGNAGLLFEKGNVEELVYLVERLITDNSFYQEIAEDCFERSKSFDINKMVSEYLILYKNILN